MVSATLSRLILHRFSSLSCRTLQTARFNKRLYGTAVQTSARLYTDKHEWVEVLGDNSANVGISHYAQEALGDVVFAQLPTVGTEIKQHDEVGALESVKAASELYSPVSGKVTIINTEVENSPGLINKDCYGKGWLFQVLLNNPDELKSLMNEDSYAKFLKTDSH